VREYAVKGLIKLQHNMPRQELSKSYAILIIQYAEQVRKLVFRISTLDRHLVCPQAQKQ